MLNRFLFICLLLLSITVAADEDQLGQAQTLLESGDAAAAYTILKALEPDRAGETGFDYLFGIAALDSGNPLDAIFALERVVDGDPTNGPARGELARAYLVLGETDNAQDEFARVLAMDLPDEARETIDRYMSNIEIFHDRTRTRFRP